LKLKRKMNQRGENGGKNKEGKEKNVQKGKEMGTTKTGWEGKKRTVATKKRRGERLNSPWGRERSQKGGAGGHISEKKQALGKLKHGAPRRPPEKREPRQMQNRTLAEENLAAGETKKGDLEGWRKKGQKEIGKPCET